LSRQEFVTQGLLIVGSKSKILNIEFDLVNYSTVLDTVERWRRDRQRHYVVLTNPHSVMMCLRDAAMRDATRAASLILPDGVGVVIAARILGYPHNGRVAGPNLMLKLCDWNRKDDCRHFFYGGAEGVADRLAEKLSSLYPGLKVVGTYSPPFGLLSVEEDNAVVERINAADPDIVWVGLGAPKQEKWMAAHIDRIDACTMIGVGAAFDFHSGNAKWAPAWVRRMGFEWVYRFVLEPHRMWRRDIDGFIFLAKVFSQVIQTAQIRLTGG
jgi:N-acetylglucosaminyldiphosphoundecaprenol N-acetyl-beta-D-mannosaminyltransferase